MAITRDKKQTLVAELNELLSNSKGMAFAQYAGVSVSELQELRKRARESGVVIKVLKNRLMRVSLGQIETYKETDTSLLTGQLIYGISADDEVAAAQVLNNFAKDYPAVQLAGGVSGDGIMLGADDIKSLASLPSKNQLIAETIAQLLSPANDILSGLSGNLHGLLDGIEAKATN